MTNSIHTQSSLPSQSDEQALTLVKLEHAHKCFGSLEVLKDISLSVEKGEVLAIIGPSGGGKSTLLRCCTLLERLDGGSLSFGDCLVAQDVHGSSVYSDKKTLRKASVQFGLVFQNFNLFPHFTVLKNLCDPACTIQKISKDEALNKAYELLKKMRFEDVAEKVPCELSGGQQQRVAIARALMLNPSVIFFDEPTSALDPELTQGVLRAIRNLAAEHMTMVIVTHEMSFARDVADRIIFMDGGVIVEEGPAKQIIENPQHKRTRLFLQTH